MCLPSSLDNGKTLTFFNYDYKSEFQTVTFEGPEIKKLFYGSFHKVSAPRSRSQCSHYVAIASPRRNFDIKPTQTSLNRSIHVLLRLVRVVQWTETLSTLPFM